MGDVYINIGTHTDVCISEGGGVTLNDAYIRQGRKMMPLETKCFISKHEYVWP